MSDELKAMLRQAPMNGFAIRTLAYIEKLEAQLAARCSADSDEAAPEDTPETVAAELAYFDAHAERFAEAHRGLHAATHLLTRTEPQAAASQEFPDIPDDDSDFTPDLARSIVAKYQNLISAETSRADGNSRSLHETMARVVHVRELAEQIIEMRWLLEPQSQADSSPQSLRQALEKIAATATNGPEWAMARQCQEIARDALAAPQCQAEIAKRPTEFLAWARETFGSIALARGERLMRFAEEAIELAHADGMERSTLDAITDRVYSREPGTIKKEIGQAQACLEMYAENVGESADALAEIEWQRVQSIPQEEWDRRHAAKQALGIALTRPQR